MENNNWSEATLRDLVDIKHGFAFQGEYFTNEEMQDVLLTPGNFAIGGGYKGEKLKYYFGEVPADYVLARHDLIVTMTDLSKEMDTLGYSALVPEKAGKRFLHNQRLGKVLIRDEKQIDKYFLFYLLRTEDYRNEVRASASGSVIRHTSPDRIRNYKFLLPPLSEQRVIAGILGALDDKIEVNRRMNATLESLARAVFYQWFMDGEDVGKWEKGRLDDLLVLQRGFDLPSPQRIPGYYPIIAASGPSGTHNEYKVKGPGVTTGRSGVIGDVYFVHEDFWPLNTSLWVKEFKKAKPAFAFYLLKTLDLAIFNAGSAVPTLNRNHIHNLSLPIPSASLIDKFEDFAMSLLNRRYHNEEESRTLGSLRDSLLPKLMRGEVRVVNGLPSAKRMSG